MPSPADTYLLDAHGQPSTAAINAEVELQMRGHRNEGPTMQAKRRELKRSVVVAVAAQQAARFGKSAAEVRILDIDDSIAALEYAGHLSRDERTMSRHHLREERQALEDHVRVTQTVLTSDVMADQIAVAA